MKRRAVLLAAIAIGAALPVASLAQGSARVIRVGSIAPSTPHAVLVDPANPFRKAFLAALRDRGYVEGRNLIYDARAAEGNLDRVPEIVADLVRLNTDVIFVPHISIAQIAVKVTTAVPIVSLAGDPVVRGLAKSHSRPGGNVTGIHAAGTMTIEQKRLELLREIAPNARRVAFVATREWWEGAWGDAMREAAGRLGMLVVHAESKLTGFSEAFAAVRKERPDAAFFEPSPTALTFRKEIGEFASAIRVPTACGHQELVETGCLMTYNFLNADTFRALADFIDRIARGAKAGDLPVYQYDRYEFAVNAKTARAIGLKIPLSVLARAHRVIE